MKRIMMLFVVLFAFSLGFIVRDQIALNKANKTIEKLEKEVSEQHAEIAILSDPGNGVIAHGRLQVEDYRLLDSSKTEIQLRGISTHGLEWYPEFTNAGAIKAIVDHGGNVIRLAVYSEYYVEAEMTDVMIMAIENALAMDVYIIIDWHVLKDENPNIYVAEALSFFELISSRYPDEPAILYEICNEPNGATTWSDIVEYSAKVIPLIRTNSPNALIIVGTPAFSTDLKSPMKEPLLYDNILYSYHKYSNTLSDYDFIMLDLARDAGICVIVSEWGFSNREPVNTESIDKVNKFLDYLDDNKISWINWSLNNKAEYSAAIDSLSDKLSRWRLRDLTDSGELVFDRLAIE